MKKTAPKDVKKMTDAELDAELASLKRQLAERLLKEAKPKK